MMSMSLSDIAILNINDVDNCGIRNSKAVNLLQKTNLNEKGGIL